MKNLIFSAALFIVLVVNCTITSAINPDLELIRKRIITELMEPQVDEVQIKSLMVSLREDGTWPGINYLDVSNTGFQHGDHLKNLVDMSRAYIKKGSKLKGDPKLKRAINSGIDYWNANDFICENWWWNQIGTPNMLVSILLILDTELTKERVAKILPMVGRAHLNASGARPSGDRIKIAGILAKTLLFNRDETQFNEVIRVIEGEIKFATGRGMQYDYSFHHREDRVNNTLSYGLGYADAFAEWAAMVAETRYKFSDPPLHQLTDYYLDGICKMMVNGKTPDPGAQNRDITRSGSLKAHGTKTIERLLKATDYRKNELEEIIKIRNGQVKLMLQHSTFFWQTEHFTFQRPTYFTSIRMHSTRNNNMEQPYNSEGLKNHHRGDGTNYLSKTGDEYFDIAPVYDWQKIPGATIVQKADLPSEKEIQKSGLSDFVGAVTNGRFGAVVFDFKSPHDPLEAKKAWFFFDEEYVCLGTGIRSLVKLPVATTLNQCLLSGEVVVRNNQEKSVKQKGEHQLDQIKWVLHDGVGYLFPEPQKIGLSNQPQSGSWYLINRQNDSPKDEIRKDVFKLWLDHGSRPENKSYQYIIVPVTNENDLELQGNRKIEILSNTAKSQAVKHNGLNLCQIIFHQAGEIQVSPELTVGMDSPGLVMIRTNGLEVKEISVADPSRKLGKIHLTISGRIEKSGDHFKSSWNNGKGMSEIAIQLPQDVYAGKSVTIGL